MVALYTQPVGRGVGGCRIQGGLGVSIPPQVRHGSPSLDPVSQPREGAFRGEASQCRSQKWGSVPNGSIARV